ncbi:MAG TPA: D-alanyl-D-alanine carboxypeptidase/D-alanyl-D-alanine-endopeptidase [Pyrinomonadaceae bacterium]|nr:D-alanyl-D-alanine carboxypeptidase/D-alanyl-D-alanine-endopeptidase [Pyrinomonadaceae bacterium]
MPDRNNPRPRAIIVSACFALLLLFTFAASRPFAGLPGQATAPAPAEKSAAREPSVKPSAAFVVSNSPSAVELGREIDRRIDESEFSRARWGVFVMSLKDGRVLYARAGDHQMAPASNMKVYTTAVALDLLGPDYRWRTSVYAEAEPDRTGTISGDLTLYGRGAPDLSSSPEKGESKSTLEQLADKLYERGVRRVSGSIVGDETYFRGDPLGDGWLWNDLQWYFGAEVSALTVNDNAVSISVTPSNKSGEAASVRLKPETSYLQIRNETNTTERNQPATIGITRGLSDNTVRVWGDFPANGSAVNARLSVHQPALWAASLFRDALQKRGITVEGKARAVDYRSSDQERSIDPEHAIELASIEGKTLGKIARETNKESINLYAELILRTLGKERGATAPEKNAEKTERRGDDEAGIAVVRQWLEQHGIATQALALHDGSGLSRLDLVTPETTARLLAAAAQTHTADAFRDSLPVAGRDGTLKGRLRSISPGRLIAKTGTLTYINSLSGYATTGDDEPLAFSIICNDETEAESSTKVIDQVAALFVSYKESNR